MSILTCPSLRCDADVVRACRLSVLEYSLSRYCDLRTTLANYLHRFDRGVVFNTLEFWGVPGFAVDYTKCFELPTPDTRRSKYTLTQENIMRYSNSSQAQLLPAHGGNVHTSG
jgi:hypothetical protein